MKPRLFVFDLDFTLWNAGGLWCDCTTPPYRRNGKHVFDSENRCIVLYPDVIEILKHLKSKNYFLAIASRTEQPDWAKQLLNLFEIRHLFDFEEIFPDSKITHFKKIYHSSRIPYNEMVFFDDEHRNIVDVSTLGVQCIHVNKGINKTLVSKFL